MPDEATPRRYSPTELLDIRERLWRERVAVGSLAAEALDLIKVSHREQALTALGHLYRRQQGSMRRVDLLKRWPAVHVLTTGGVAADHYESGTFWPALDAQLGLGMDQYFRREWGTAFLANLQALGLPTFDDDEDAGTRYVGRILMHSGIPTYCLRDYYRLIGERRARSIGLDPEEFVSWAKARATQDQLYGIDKPVARFLRYGGDFAVDVTDRTFDLLDAVAAGATGSDVALPERFRRVALEIGAEGRLAPAQRSSGRSSGNADVRPRLVVDPYGQGPLLRLPPVGDAPDGSAVWLVELDGVTTRAQTRALFPGLSEPAPQTDVPIPGPVRSASAALADRQHLSMTLTVIDDADPLLAFGEDASAIPSGLPLPDRPTWLLFPGSPESLRVSGNAPVLAESPLPPGWAGWCLVLVDLAGALSVSIGPGRAHSVRHQAAARILAGEQVPGVRTTTGLPVFASAPTISLPSELGNANWEVSLLDGGGATLRQWRSDHGGDANSVWSAIPRPVIGTFTIRVRGPWGRGASRTVTVVEGIRVTFNPAWRRFVRAGLQRGESRVTAHPAMNVSPEVVQYSERDRMGQVRVGTRNEFRTLVVTPPHMTVAYQTAKTTSAPSIQPAKLFREDVIDEPGTLIVNVGAAAEPRLHVRVPSGSIQIIPSSAGRTGNFQFSLSKMVDTLRFHAQVQLSLDDGGTIEVATVNPRRLFRDAKLAGDGIEFTDCVEAEGLTAFLYPTRAPWREPVMVPITHGRVTLPPALINAGPLRLRVRIDDPWAPIPAPGWSDSTPSILLDCEGHVRSESDEETAVSVYLAGEGELPRSITDLTRLWTARGLLDDLALGPRIPAVAEDIDRVLHASPRAALLSLSGSQVPNQAIPSLLITAGLACANLGQAHDDVPPIWSVRSALPATLLSAADAEWSAEEVHAATEVCGEVIAKLVAGEDPFASDGRLDASADVFDRQPAMREDFIRQAGLVPKGLLSGDSRRIAAMDFVKNRRDRRLAELMHHADTVFVEGQSMLRVIGDPLAERAFQDRRHAKASRGWRVVPAISLGFALVARHAARGHRASTAWLAQRSRVWADLAAVAPSMVTIDIVVAELLVAKSSTFESGEKTSQ